MKTRAFVLIVESNVSGDFEFQVVPLSRFDSDVFFSWHLPPRTQYQNPNISLTANKTEYNQILSNSNKNFIPLS